MGRHNRRWRRNNTTRRIYTMATIREHGNEELLDVLYIVPVFTIQNRIDG